MVPAHTAQDLSKAVVLEAGDLVTAVSLGSGCGEGADLEAVSSRVPDMAAVANRAEVLGKDYVGQWGKGLRS